MECYNLVYKTTGMRNCDFQDGNSHSGFVNGSSMAMGLLLNFPVPQFLTTGRGAHIAVNITEQCLEPWKL